MRFEPPKILLKHREAVLPKFRLNAAAISFHLPAIGLRKLRLKRRSRAVVLPPPELLRRVPDGAEVRPSGFDKYDRRFTNEGGIELRYKDVERTLPVILAKLAVLIASWWLIYYAVRNYSPILGVFWNSVLCLALMVACAAIILRDKEVLRRIEIRPDCMIIEGVETFWKENMQLGWPGFMPSSPDQFVLCGVYGSRWLEYLSIRRFDENDRAPELFATQLAAAMAYQWDPPSKGV